MPDRANSLKEAHPPPAVLTMLIVARDQAEVYRSLRRRLKNCLVAAVILDRREGERRQAAHSVPGSRRRGERRSALHLRNDLRHRKYIFARPQARCPHD